jgi:hypothetical protein
LTTFGVGISKEFSHSGFGKGALSEQTVTRLAAQSGLSRGQFLAQSGSQGSFYTDALARDVAAVTQRVMPAKGFQVIDDWKREHNKRPGDRLSSGEVEDLQMILAQEVPEFDPYMLANVLNSSYPGAQMGPKDAMDLMLQGVVGGGAGIRAEGRQSATEARAHRVGQVREKTMRTDDRGYQLQGKVVQGRLGKRIESLRLDSGHQSIGQQAVDFFGFGADSTKDKIDRYIGSYTKALKDTHVQSPIVEGLIKKHDTGMRFEVRDNKGKRRVVPLDEAIENYYDQLVSGEATVVRGNRDDMGKDVAAVTRNQKMTETQMDHLGLSHYGRGRGHNRATHGDSLHDWMKTDEGKDFRKFIHAGAGGVGGGQIRISATPELQRLINIIPQGHIFQKSRREGTVVAPNVSPHDRPSG